MYDPEPVINPSPVQQQPPAQVRVVQATGNQNPIQTTFNPVVYQGRVKRCSKCLYYMGWIFLVCGAINVVVNTISLLFMDKWAQISYQDIDGQIMYLRLGSNTLYMISLFKIIIGLLMLKQGKITKKVYKPILKEYRDAENGITQGIVMNKRRSKSMVSLKKKICRITAITFVVGFLYMVYIGNLSMDILDQWIE